MCILVWVFGCLFVCVYVCLLVCLYVFWFSFVGLVCVYVCVCLFGCESVWVIAFPVAVGVLALLVCSCMLPACF